MSLPQVLRSSVPVAVLIVLAGTAVAAHPQSFYAVSSDELNHVYDYLDCGQRNRKERPPLCLWLDDRLAEVLLIVRPPRRPMLAYGRLHDGVQLRSIAIAAVDQKRIGTLIENDGAFLRYLRRVRESLQPKKPGIRTSDAGIKAAEKEATAFAAFVPASNRREAMITLGRAALAANVILQQKAAPILNSAVREFAFDQRLVAQGPGVEATEWTNVMARVLQANKATLAGSADWTSVLLQHPKDSGLELFIPVIREKGGARKFAFVRVTKGAPQVAISPILEATLRRRNP